VDRECHNDAIVDGRSRVERACPNIRHR
jgi:hypothetical protein